MLLAQEKAVRVLLLSLVQQLSLPEKPTSKQVEAAANAAGTLRKRILKEKERVQARISRMESDLANQTRVRDPNNLDGEDDEDEKEHRGARQREYDLETALREDKSRELTRHEFLFVTEMQGKGNRSVLVELLCLHGMRHADDLLPQLLKLLAAMTAPPERLCGDRHRVADAVEQLRKACATDDFFSLLVQCVAPIAGKRRDGPLPRKDVMMLELILCVFNNLLTGPEAAVVSVVGAMCRSHGVELLLVVLHQNYERFLAIQNGEDDQVPSTQQPAKIEQSAADEVEEADEEGEEALEADVAAPEEIIRSDSPVGEGDALMHEADQLEVAPDIFGGNANGTLLEIVDDDGIPLIPDGDDVIELFIPDEPDNIIDATVVQSTAVDDLDDANEDDLVELTKAAPAVDSDEESEEESAEESSADEEEDDEEEEDELEIDDEAFKHDMALAELLQEEQEEIRGETYGNILNWNLLILNAMSLIFRCGVPSIDLASWTPDSETANVFSLVKKSAAQMQQQQREDTSWRHFARHRNGSTSSCGLIVRRRVDEKPPQVVLGSVTQLLSGQHRSPLDRLIEADKKKRAKFSKKQLVPRGMTDVLPVPTLLHLTKQIATFLSSGFEALSQMVWQHIREQLLKLEDTTKELQGLQARPAFVDEGPMISELSGIQVSDAIRYCGTCAAMMRLTRDSLKQHRDVVSAGGSLSADAQRLLEEHWRAASHVMTLEHVQRGFDILNSFLVSRQLFAEEDVCVAMDYVSEMLLVLVSLMAGEIVDDPAVTMPAHALGSSLLFNEANVRAVWGWIGHPRITTHKQLQSATLLLHSLFALMERSSFNGAFSMPKRRGHATKKKNNPTAEGGNVADAAAADDDEDEEEEDDQGDDKLLDDPELAKFIDDGDDEDAVRRQKRLAKKSAATSNQQPKVIQQSEVVAGQPLLDDEVDEREYNAMLASSAAAENIETVEIDETDEPLTHEDAAEHQRSSISQGRRSVSRDSGRHSTTSSGHVSLSSEREAHVEDFYVRLSQPKNAQMLLRTFQTWRLNEGEANSALEALLDRLQKHQTARCVLFTVHFLAVVNDVLHHGKESNPTLFEICDRIAFDFFNPPRNSTTTVADPAVAAAMWRTDLALRCARSLFFIPPTSYFVLDIAGLVRMPEPLPPQGRGVDDQNEDVEVVVDEDGYVTSVGPKKPRAKRAPRRRARAADGAEEAPLGDEEEKEALEALFQEALEQELQKRRKKHHRPTAHEIPPAEGDEIGARNDPRERGDDEPHPKRHRREMQKKDKHEKKEKKHKKDKNRHRRGSDKDLQGDGADAEASDAVQTFMDESGHVCIVGDDGLVYQVQGDEESGYYYIYQPGGAAPGAVTSATGAAAHDLTGDGLPREGDRNGDQEDAAAAEQYRRQQDDDIKKLQDARTIAEPHHIDPPRTLDFLQGTD